MAAASGIRAGAAYVELFVKNNRLVKGLDAAAARLKAFGASITALGARIAGLGATLAMPFLGAAKLFADMGSDMLDMSLRTGVAVEALSELRYAAKQSGASAEDLERGLRIMSRNIIEAARGSAQARRNLSRLGLTIADLNGLSPDEQFELIADRLSRIQNPANRATIAMEIFGRTGASLLPLLSTGAQGIQELRREGDRLGATMSVEDARAAKAFSDALFALWKSLRQVAFMVGAALAPTLKQIADWITRIASNLGSWIDENREVITVIAAVIASIVGLGAAFMVLGPIISAAGAAIGLVTFVISAAATAVGLLGAAIGFLLSPIGLVVAALGGIVVALGAVFATSDKGKQSLSALSEGFGQIKSAAGTAFQGVTDAIAAGDWAGAMEVAWLGIKAAWAAGVAAISKVWRNFKSFFVELFWGAVDAVVRWFNMGWTGIKIAFWTVVNALANGWDKFVAGLKIAFNNFVGFFRRAWARVKNLFSPESMQREIEAINKEIDEQNRKTLEQLGRTMKERDKRVSDAWEEGFQRHKELLQKQEEERRKRQQEMEAANAADQERVAAAMRELEEKAAELARKREEKERERDLATDRKPTRRPEFDLEGLDEAEARMDVKGTFSAFAVAGLGTDTLAERTARASEQVAQNTRQLVREAQNGGLVFA